MYKCKKDPENKKQFSVEADYVHISLIFSPFEWTQQEGTCVKFGWI